jgi:hypothetical protein
MTGQQLTAWGEWVARQPRGILTKAQRATGLAYSTVHGAQFRLVREYSAVLLAKFSRGGVKADDISLERAQRRGSERAA